MLRVFFVVLHTTILIGSINSTTGAALRTRSRQEETVGRKQLQDNLELAVQQALPPINYIGEDGPFGLCQGDCDGDSTCLDGLECFDRNGFEPVPGCSGEGQGTDTVAGKDICYDPNTAAPTPVPSASPTISEPTISPQPTPPPTIAPTTASPTPAPTRSSLAILDDGLKPFGKCEGECADDDDCRDRHLCQKRGNIEFVPGCEGNGVAGANYCYDPEDGPPPPSLPDGSFRLRLYWEKGYYWQETYSEFRYCMQYNGGGNRPTVQTCKSSSSKFEFVYLPGQGDQIRASGTNDCIDHTGNTAVTFEECDPNDRHQRWMGNWAAGRFDIRSVSRTENYGCLTQHHHPKSGEEVFINPCLEAHLTDTGWWNRE